MILGGAIRFSQWDIDAKKATPIMCQAFLRLSSQVDHLFAYGQSLTDSNMIAFVKNLPKLSGFWIDDKDWKEGWVYNGNGALGHMIDLIDTPIDWVLFPDSDDLLPSNVRQEVEKAEAAGCTCIEFPRVDMRGDMVMDVNGYVGGPHVLGAKFDPRPAWKCSQGFNWPDNTPPMKVYHCPYPSRHLRYSSEMLIAARKAVGYSEDYCDKEWKLAPFRDDWTIDDYIGHFKK